MLNLERQKLFEAILFFLKNTKYCGLVKLFKLLYYLDMLHFRETGRSVSGLLYKALPYGPVPTALYDELGNPPPDLAQVISITSPPPKDSESTTPPLTIIKARKHFNSNYLTKREQRIANEIAEIFRDVKAEDISDISHARNGPWDLAKKRGHGKWNQIIDYLDSLNLSIGSGQPISFELLKAREEEFLEARRFFN